MIELTAQQIADGWIAHDGSIFPEAALAYEKIEKLEMGGGSQGATSSSIEKSFPILWEWRERQTRTYARIAWRPAGSAARVAFKPAAPQAATVTDPNAAMLAADERPAYDVKAMAGNGCIFGTPRVERCNLLVVAPISATGFSVWGA